MASRTAAGDARRPDDAIPAIPVNSRLDRYAEAKDGLAAALGTYLGAVVELGNGPASSLELARVTLEHEINTAIDQLLLTVPLTEEWSDLVRTELRAGRRADRG